MIDLEFLERLIAAIDRSSLDSIEIERGGTRVRLAKTPTGIASSVTPQPAQPGPNAPGPVAGREAAPAAGSETPSNLVEVTSPMVGTFYQAPAPDAPPYVERGKRISRGDTLCIIEAMKLMNELEAEVDGTIVDILVGNAQPVEYGQVLFRVEPR